MHFILLDTAATGIYTLSLHDALPISVGVSLLEEAVPALLGLVGHVGEAGGLAGEHLLADEAVIDQVEGELQHPLSRSEEHTSELQSRPHLVCRPLLEKKKKITA